MTDYLVTVEHAHSSGLPEDSAFNNFAIDAFPGWDPATALGEVTIPVAQFFKTVQAGTGQSIDSYLSAGISRAALSRKLRVYDIESNLDGSPHGSPVAMDSSTPSAAINDDPLPEEVALCLTIRGDGWSEALIEEPDEDVPADAKVDRPRQRHSGRIYIGPLGVAALDTATLFARPNATFLTTVLDAAEALQAALSANGHNWAVWSRKDALLRNLTDVQVDNAFDSQRRRGVAPTIRQTRAV